MDFETYDREEKIVTNEIYRWAIKLMGRALSFLIAIFFWVRKVNGNVPKGHIPFLIYVNDLSKNILRSLVSISADDTTDYGYASKKYMAKAWHLISLLS